MSYLSSMMKTVRHYFSNLNISRKILLGYLFIAIITIVLGVVAISSLDRINRLNSSVINIHSPILKTSEALSDAVLSLELYGRRYAILKSPEAFDLFNLKSTEARDLIQQLENLLTKKGLAASPKISPLLEEYIALFRDGKKYLASPETVRGKKFDEQIKNSQEELLTMIRNVTMHSRKEQNESIQSSYQTSMEAFWITVALCSLGILAGITAATLITKHISSSLHTLQLATRHISDGKFNDIPLVESKDEIGKLSRAFGEMAVRLRTLEEMYLDASPLTRLPGGIAIENVLKKRLAGGETIAFCLLDIDNFKAYNDYYGYARGSELIQSLGRIIEETTRQMGSPTDFVGHIGGDDFVLISTPDAYRPMCTAIIEAFDRMVLDYYDDKAREQGFITGKTRQGERVTYPIATISIAVVTNRKRHVTSHLEIGEIASELKEYAKSIPGSLFVVDHRRKED